MTLSAHQAANLQGRAGFARSWAVVVGIDKYDERDGIPCLRNAVSDASELGRVLVQHGYEVISLFDEQATKDALATLLKDMPEKIGVNDRLLFYFAGHGKALDGQDGPEGFLLPHDARRGHRNTYFSMQQLYEALDVEALSCRHRLLILDCCFAGAFRWVQTRDIVDDLGNVPLYLERYHRFVQNPAWQVLTSASYDQKALDDLSGLGSRGVNGKHSPFATQLFKALSGAADVNDGVGDGVLTLTEIYMFVRDNIVGGDRQTPGLWLMPKHDRGEYVFLVPGRELSLPPAPKLDEALNPYKGLNPYESKDKDIFFGRRKLVNRLSERVQAQPFVAIVGASGTGKSSLMLAGLLPAMSALGWQIGDPIRPGTQPIPALQTVSLGDQPFEGTTLSDKVAAWKGSNPDGSFLLLVVDQFEDLISVCQEDEQRDSFLIQLRNAIEAHHDRLRVVISLRSDFEPQFTGEGEPLAQLWSDSHTRFVVPPMTQDELREVILKPAELRVLHFEPDSPGDSLVEQIINEVGETPGALPLLSFTLSELYRRYLDHVRQDDEVGRKRALIEQDYIALGRVAGALQQRANQEYQSLDAAGQATMKRLMLRMVTIEGGERTRRRVALAELEYDEPMENARVGVVLDRLVEARLVVRGQDAAGESYVEPAHDALLNCWGQLWRWSSDAQETLLLQRALSDDASNWLQSGRPHGTLWDSDPRLNLLDPAAGNRLSILRRLAGWVRSTLLPAGKRTVDWLNRREAEFVRASRARRQWNQRVILGIIAILVLLTAGALVAANIAVANEQQAQRQTRVARAQALAASALAQLDGDPKLGVLLAMEAVSVTHIMGEPIVPQAESVLHSAILNWPLRVTLRGHTAPVSKAIWSPDGQLLVTISEDGTARIWEPVNGEERAILRGHQGKIRDVDWSSDGRFIVTAGEDGTAKVWSTFDWQELHTLRGHTELLYTAEWSPDGRFIVTASRDKTAKVWDTSTYQLFSDLRGHTQDVFNASWSSDGLRIVTSSADGTARIWNTALVEEPISLIGHTGMVFSAAWSPDGRFVVTASEDRTAKVWDATEGKVQTTLSSPGDSVWLWRAVWNPNGNSIVTISVAGAGRIWDPITGEIIATLPTRSGSMFSVAWSPSGRWILTTIDQGVANVWDGTTGEELAILDDHTGIVGNSAWSPDEGAIVTVGVDGTAKIWDLGIGQERPMLRGHRGAVYQAVWSPDKHFIITAGNDGTAIVWDARGGFIRNILRGHTKAVQGVDWSPDGRFVVTGSDDGTAIIWDAASGQRDKTLTGHSGAIWRVHWSPDGRFIATASLDKTAKVWDATDGKNILNLSGHTEGVLDVSWNPNSNMIATASIDGTTKIWNIVNGQEVITLEGHSEGVRSVAWSPDGRWVATGGGDWTAKIWDSKSWKEERTLRGHGGKEGLTAITGLEGVVVFTQRYTGLTSVTWSPDSLYLATTSYDGTAKLWYVHDWQERSTLPGHIGYVYSADWSPDGHHVVTSGEDGTARQYVIPIDDLLVLARNRVTRDLTPQERALYLGEPVPILTPDSVTTPDPVPIHP